ncbi:hypothetical protein MHI48_18180 [Paenibacillus sp. FSL H7-0942]|uniref:hypothetical protein n=1 Tax=Paenibacillus sp. FSL H7-0942 TaxID=2921444 RepID=UPI003249A8EB
MIAAFILTIVYYKKNIINKTNKIHLIITGKLKINNENKVDKTQIKKFRNELMLIMLNSLIIDKWSKLFIHLFILVFSFTMILVSMDFTPNNIVEKQFIGILVIVVFIGIGIFIERRIGRFYNQGFYFLKVLIVLNYPLVTFQSYLDNINIIGLFVTVIITIGYTSALIKNSIEIFNSLLFQYFNFIVVLILLNLLIIGLCFGLYYLNYNEVFQFYSEYEVKKINDGGLKYISYVIYVGISPFFSFPGQINLNHEIIHFVPLIEYLLGYLFNLSIVAFFISYSISKYFERRNSNMSDITPKKLENNSISLEQN